MKVLIGFKHTSTGFSTHGLPNDCPAGSAESDDSKVLHIADTDMDMHIFVEDTKIKANALRKMDEEYEKLDYAFNDAEYNEDQKEMKRLRNKMREIGDYDQPREIRQERLKIREIMKFKTLIVVEGNTLTI